MNPIVAPILKAVEAIAVWLNPDRREKAILRKSIEAAEQLILILRKEGQYLSMTDVRRKKLEAHYQKQFNAWKDGSG